MNKVFTSLVLGLAFAAPHMASAQETPPQDKPPTQQPGGSETLIIPVPIEAAPSDLEPGKDLTVRSPEGRAEMLDDLFSSLRLATKPEAAEQFAEEIWAVFLQSGSKSVDFLLLRGIAAENNGDHVLARRMYNHVTRLSPEYAEGWSRSGALAIKEDNLNLAVTDITQALVIEPRHFYALWRLGNILETLERPDEAFEAYTEAQKLYPIHEEITARVDALKEDVAGTAL